MFELTHITELKLRNHQVHNVSFDDKSGVKLDFKWDHVCFWCFQRLYLQLGKILYIIFKLNVQIQERHSIVFRDTEYDLFYKSKIFQFN